MVHLLRSRTGPPPPPANHVRRRDAQAVLDRDADRDLVLVSASPDFGKTSLLAAWVGDEVTTRRDAVLVAPEQGLLR